MILKRSPGDSKPPGPDRIWACPAAGALERGVSLPEGNRTRQRSRTRSNGVAVVAASDDPVTILLADDLADVVTPNDNGPNRWSTGIRTIVSPRPGEVIGRARIAADLPTHIPPAPCPGPTRIMVVTTSMVVMVIARPSLCARSN
jgi:hypothetical protein